ncbi:hypothetical protein [Kitasatospora sp. CB02891]|uniref:hypothetical protein n=1 Tax=Kitasatospora sp. CB02891 TaxID=2020329 RepID=UPI0012FD52C8|nr:hypothetical protein [Kitasatospora sp. CB02891]
MHSIRADHRRQVRIPVVADLFVVGWCEEGDLSLFEGVLVVVRVRRMRMVVDEAQVTWIAPKFS